MICQERCGRIQSWRIVPASAGEAKNLSWFWEGRGRKQECAWWLLVFFCSKQRVTGLLPMTAQGDTENERPLLCPEELGQNVEILPGDWSTSAVRWAGLPQLSAFVILVCGISMNTLQMDLVLWLSGRWAFFFSYTIISSCEEWCNLHAVWSTYI